MISKCATSSHIPTITGSPNTDNSITTETGFSTTQPSDDTSLVTKRSQTNWSESAVTSEEMDEVRWKFRETGGPMHCPVENCNKSFTTFPGIRYHLLHHNSQRTSILCPKCGKKFLGEKRLQTHIFKQHPEGPTTVENPSDEEYNPDCGDSASAKKDNIEIESESSGNGQDDEEGSEIETPNEEEEAEEMEIADENGGTEESTTPRIPVRLRKSNVPTRYCGNTTYHSYVKGVLRRVRGEGEELLFREWLPHSADWEIVPEGDVIHYTPDITACPPITFSLHSSTISTSHQSHTLTSWSLVTDDCGVVFSVGGPVWTMDWAPVTMEMTNQILAIAPYRRRYDTFQMETSFVMKGTIQIWDVGVISTATDTPPTPHMSFAVAHEFGIVREVKWCPSGCYQSASMGPREGEGEGKLPRLGLLAVASSDGFARILSIPHTMKGDNSKSNNKQLLFASPKHVAVVLAPYGMGTPTTTPSFQCLCLDWLPGNGHSRIAAGFSNGMVCIWDLGCQFQTVPTPDGRSRTIHPIIDIPAHFSPCTSISWCPLDQNFLCTGGQDRDVNVWDVRQPSTPMETNRERGAFLLRGLVWPLLWPAVFTVAGIATSVQMVSFSHNVPGARPTKTVSDNYAPTSSMSYCMWSDRLAAATFSGEVTVTTIPTAFYHRVSSKLQLQRLQKVVLDTKVETTVDKDVEERRRVEGRGEVGREGRVEVGREGGASQLVYVHNPKKKVGHYSVQQPLVASVNVVRWNGNETCHEWLALGTNSGLVHILHVPQPPQKPDLYLHRRKKNVRKRSQTN